MAAYTRQFLPAPEPSFRANETLVHSVQATVFLR